MSETPARLTAALADRYRLERELGHGGMATVYLAEDLKHHRKVAVKVLRPELAAALGSERFLREIETTANLRHPNILPLFDSGVASTTADSPDRPPVEFVYYVMPFVEGESLRDRLTREQQLPLEESLQFAREVADALGYAHSRGVIHRDIKPENILLERGHAVVADFGIARAVSSAGPEKLTQTGIAIGTPVYMSPEQSVGEIDLDGRSDLYALGCVLYEMLAGEPPYTGASAQAIIAKRFREPVPRISTLRETVPAALEYAISRVLAKAPADRFATATEFTAAISPSAEVEGAPAGGGEEFWVAVLPFRVRGGSTDLEALAEGMTEAIVTGLLRFSYLRVLSRRSTARLADEAIDARAAGSALGARYVMEGSLQQAGSALRVSVQLADAHSGAQLWSEKYDRPFSPEAIFALQDELVPRIVSSVADAHGILPHTLSESLRGNNPDRLTPYEAVLRSFGYGYRMTPEEHTTVRAGLERAVQQAPGYADAWGMLSLLYTEEFSNGFNVRPDPLGRALQAARRAADAAPSSALSYNALARALFFRKEFPGFRIAAERAIELNPFNGPTLAGLGAMISYAGDWEHGSAIVERAMKLNPRHPGGYWFPLFYNAYRQCDYRGALNIGLKINLPDFFATHEALASAYGQLGEREAAGKAVRDLLRLKPDFVASVREELGKWFDRDLVEHQIDGLRKAGLEVAGTKAPPTSASPRPAGHSVAVLPFVNMSADPENEYFSDGMTEELISVLTRTEGIRVASRSSVFAYKGRSEDVRVIGRALNVDTVVAGSVRKAGARIRLSAQLTTIADGYQVWADTFDRDLSDVFAVQDEVSQAIARALQVRLVSRADRPAGRNGTENVEAYTHYLRGRFHWGRRTESEIAKGLAHFQEALALDPGYALAEIGVADSYNIMGFYDWLHPSEAFPRALTAANRALALDDTLAAAYCSRAYVRLYYEWQWSASEEDFRRAEELAPAYATASHYHGNLLIQQGRFAEGEAAMRRAVASEPLSLIANAAVGWALYYAGRHDAAITQYRNTIELDRTFALGHLWLGQALVQIGAFEEAVAEYETTIQLSGRSAIIIASLARAHVGAGRRSEADRLVAELDAMASRRFVPQYDIAGIFAAAGDRDTAFSRLERALTEREHELVFLAVDPALASLRPDPRFGSLAARIGL